ncbi:MAG: hypothetical protein JSS49_27560 [Planctomycetes bacterium]|nr:hypothetical protein [Planctomycetota bacterium]
MPIVRVLIVPFFLAAIALTGCGSQKPAAPPPAAEPAAKPGAAESLPAAKELAEIAHEKYLKTLKQIAEIDKLMDRAREIGSGDETIENLQKSRDKWMKLSYDAKEDWDKAKAKVKRLAKEVLR